MPRVNGTTAGQKKTLIPAPTSGLANTDWVGSITIQRDEVKTDNTTATTGYICICLGGVHNSNAGPGTPITPTLDLCDIVLSSAQPSVTIDLGTDKVANSVVQLSRVTWTNTVDNEGIHWFTTEA